MAQATKQRLDAMAVADSLRPTLLRLARELRREKFFTQRGEVYWRERGESGFKPFTPGDEKRLRAAFEAAGRAHLLDL